MVAASAIALSGCVVFKTAPTAKQKGSSVVITVRGCASQSSGSPPGSCTSEGNSGSNAGPFRSQVFLGFLVPTVSKPPRSFTATAGPASGGHKLHFTPSKSYKGQLQTNSPAPSGEKWVGYRTAYFAYNDTSGQQNFTAKVAFVLPKSAKGKFKYEVTIGGRAFGASGANPKQPIDCMGSLTTEHQSGPEAWICVDDSATGKLKLH